MGTTGNMVILFLLTLSILYVFTPPYSQNTNHIIYIQFIYITKLTIFSFY